MILVNKEEKPASNLFFYLLYMYVMTSDLGEVAAEAGRPAALGAGPHAAHVLLAQDLVTALRVGAPRQVGAAFHVASEQGILILREDIERIM